METRSSFLHRLVVAPGLMDAARVSLGGRWLRVGDTRLYYERTGRGSEPVVFVTSSSIGFWRLAWPLARFESSERYSAIAIATSRPARDLPRLVRGLGLQRIVLVIDGAAAGPIFRSLADTGAGHVRGIVWIADPRVQAPYERDVIARAAHALPLLVVVPGNPTTDLAAWTAACSPAAEVHALGAPVASARGRDELFVALHQFLERLG
jgi:hypothetical protein